MPARGAADEAYKQRRTGGTACGAWGGALGGLERLDVDQRFVSCDVDVLTNSQFAEIDAVAEQLPNAALSHSEPPCKITDRDPSGGSVMEGGSHFGSAVVEHQATGCLVAPIAGRRLPKLPNAPLRCGSAQVVKAFDVRLPLILMNGRQNVALQPSAARHGIDAFLCHDDPATGSVNAVVRAQLLADVASQARQVADDDAGVSARFDALDRSQQRRALLERQTTRHI
jgi:hypothetical protein